MARDGSKREEWSGESLSDRERVRSRDFSDSEALIS
jgi:hypothetical protein